MTTEVAQRPTQVMRGRPVTNAEAMEAALRLVARAYNGSGPKSTMSIPVQASDDDVLLTDYLLEANSLQATIGALCQALIWASGAFDTEEKSAAWAAYARPILNAALEQAGA